MVLAIRRQVLSEDHPNTARAYLDLARCQHAQGRDNKAEELLLRAAEIFRSVRLRVASAGLDRAAFASQRSPLALLVTVLARNGKPKQAWQYFEERCGRGTGDELTARQRRTPDEKCRLTELLARLDQIDRSLQALARPKPTPEQEKQRQDLLTQQRQALDDLNALRQQLEQKYGVREGQVFSLARIQAQLPVDTAIIAWIDLKGSPKAADPKGDHWAVVVRKQGQPAWVHLAGSGPQGAWIEEDDKLLDQLRKALQAEPGAEPSNWQTLAQRLARQRLEPLAVYLAARGDLPAVRHLVVLPSGKMDGIPLDVLTDRYTVSRAPSATLYAYLRGLPRPDSRGLLAVADPIFQWPAAPPSPVPPAGVLLTTVAPGTNAARAGLKPGDVLLRYDQTRLSQRGDLKPRAESDDPKAAVEVEVWRAGQTLTRSLRPGKLGVRLADEPAPVALTNLRKLDRPLTHRGKDGKDWNPLPGTRVEVKGLQKLFTAQGQPVTLLLGADANEPKLAELAHSGALGGFRYLHFATHGTYDLRFPLQSAVILCQDKEPEIAPISLGRYVFDGELTAAEVLEDWKLNADLVTLSACETGLGKYEQGEGFMGFAQAVLLTGGRSVCLSLWGANDTATALLMTRFYENLLGQRAGLKAPLSKAAALAEAKAWLRGLSMEEVKQLAGREVRGKNVLLPKLRRAVLGASTVGLTGLPFGQGSVFIAAALIPERAPKPAPQVKGVKRPFAHPHYWAAFVLVGDTE